VTIGSLVVQPWQVALAAAGLSLLLYAIARVQLERAKDDWANAFFYSPSSKPKQRQRRQRWQDRCTVLLLATFGFAAASAVLYVASTRVAA
jgi:hypothetical protein